MSTSKTITLQATDGEKFTVTETIANEMGMVKLFLEASEEQHYFSDDNETTVTVPLLKVSSSTLKTIIEYHEAHAKLKEEKRDREGDGFDEAFVKDMSNDMVKEILLGANYLDSKELLEMMEKVIAKRIENKSPEFVRKFFGVECDFSKEEEAEIREQYRFAFEGVDKD